MLHCEESIAYERARTYVLHRSNAAPGRAVCFLGRFLPKLGGAACAAFFLWGVRFRWRLHPGCPTNQGHHLAVAQSLSFICAGAASFARCKGAETMSATATDPRLTHAILAVIEEARGRGISDEAIIEIVATAIEAAADLEGKTDGSGGRI
jgi:hypothetical protein